MSAGTGRRLLMVAAIVLFTLADVASGDSGQELSDDPPVDESDAADQQGIEDQPPVAPEEGGEAEPSGAAPVAEANGPYSGVEGSLISFTSEGSFDPDGDPLSFLWDFGDGQTSSGTTSTHVYDNDGSFVVTLTVADDSGQTDTDTAEVTISVAAPPAPEEPATPLSDLPVETVISVIVQSTSTAESDCVNDFSGTFQFTVVEIGLWQLAIDAEIQGGGIERIGTISDGVFISEIVDPVTGVAFEFVIFDFNEGTGEHRFGTGELLCVSALSFPPDAIVIFFP